MEKDGEKKRKDGSENAGSWPLKSKIGHVNAFPPLESTIYFQLMEE